MTRGTWSDAGMSTSLNHEVTRLIHKKEYLFRVKAVNAIGESEPLETEKSIIAKNQFGIVLIYYYLYLILYIQNDFILNNNFR